MMPRITGRINNRENQRRPLGITPKTPMISNVNPGKKPEKRPAPIRHPRKK